MGAYTNPQTIVDTQSGQHVRDMIGSVAKTGITFFENRQKEIKALKEADSIKNAKNAASWEKYNTDFLEKNVTLTYNKEAFFMGASKVIDQLQTLVDSGTASDAEKFKLAELKSNTLNNPALIFAQTALMSDNYNTTKTKGVGNYGGLWSGLGGDDTDKEKYAKYKKYQDASLGDGFGYKTTNVELNPGKEKDYGNLIMTSTIQDVNDPGKSEKLEISNGYATFMGDRFPNSTPYTLLDERENYKKILLTATGEDGESVFTKKINDKVETLDGGLNIDYLISRGDEFGSIKSTSVGNKIVTNGETTSSSTTQVYEPDIRKISELGSIKMRSEAAISSLIESNPTGLIMTYNDILLKGLSEEDQKSLTSKAPKDLQDVKWLTANKRALSKAYAFLAVQNNISRKSFPILGQDGKPILITNRTKNETDSGTLTPSQAAAAKKKEAKFISTLASGKFKIGDMEFKKVGGDWYKVINTGLTAKGNNLTTKIDKDNPQSKDVDENYLRNISGN